MELRWLLEVCKWSECCLPYSLQSKPTNPGEFYVKIVHNPVSDIDKNGEHCSSSLKVGGAVADPVPTPVSETVTVTDRTLMMCERILLLSLSSLLRHSCVQWVILWRLLVSELHNVHIIRWVFFDNNNYFQWLNLACVVSLVSSLLIHAVLEHDDFLKIYFTR